MSSSTHAVFSARTGSVFRVDVAPVGTALLTLHTCSPLQLSGGYSSYTLTFSGPASQPLAQGTFTFVGDDLDPVDIFIVPIRRTADSIDYEAVFNESED